MMFYKGVGLLHVFTSCQFHRAEDTVSAVGVGDMVNLQMGLSPSCVQILLGTYEAVSLFSSHLLYFNAVSGLY